MLCKNTKEIVPSPDGNTDCSLERRYISPIFVYTLLDYTLLTYIDLIK